MSLKITPRWRSIILQLVFLGCLAVPCSVRAAAQSVAAQPGATQVTPAPAAALDDGDKAAQAGIATEQNRTTGGNPSPPLALRWLWELGNGGNQSRHLPRAMIVALALLLAFLTVVQVWQIPPQSTSLTEPTRPPKSTEGSQNTAQPAGGRADPAPSTRIGTLFDSNFSRTVLSGLGGLAVVSFINGNSEALNFKAEAYYFVLFVLFFLTGLLLSAMIRGLGEAVRSRIVLSRPAVLWPPPSHKEFPRSYAVGRKLRYWLRRGWYWLASFRATLVVFVDTAFNVLMGKNQLQTAIFSETITDLHESLLEAAEQVREEVHQAVLRALLAEGALPGDLPHEERVRVGVSLLSSDETSVYYIAWERGCLPQRFDQHSVAWLSAFKGEARWAKSDPHDAPENERKLNLIYQGEKAVLVDNTWGDIPGPRAEILLRQYYQRRGTEDYEAFVVLPMPWVNRGRAGNHRRGAIHISFKRAAYMDALWDNLETWDERRNAIVPNYTEWKGLLDSTDLRPRRLLSERRPASGGLGELIGRAIEGEALALRQEASALEPWILTTEEKRDSAKGRRITIKNDELCSVLHQSLEVLGRALSHFDDEVYEVYVQARHHSMEIPR